MTRSVGLKVLILFVVLFGLWMLHAWQPNEEDLKRQADKEAIAKHVHELQIQFAFKMQQELNLYCSGDCGRMHDKIEEIGYSFTAYRRASIEEARILLLTVTDRLVDAVNSDTKLRPYLDVYPFTYKHISVAIVFEGPCGRYCDGSVVHCYNIPDIAVEENRNKLFYKSKDPYTGIRQNLLSEHYAEAIQRAAESPIPIIKVHQTTPLEAAIDEVLPPYVEEMLMRYRFECETIGGKMDQLVEDIGAQFVLRKRTSHEEARKYMLEAVTRLLEALNSNEKLRPFLSEFPFPSNRLKIRIRFAKSNYYPYKDGSLESVSLENDKITYYKQPPPDWVVYTGPDVVGKESYQTAVEKAAQ